MASTEVVSNSLNNSTNGFNKANSTSRNRSGSINIGRNRSNSNDSENNTNNNIIDNESETNSKNTSSPILTSKLYTNIVEYSKAEFNLMTKSLKYIDKNRYYSSIKCTILGLSGVGKTSFIRRFSSGEFLIEESTTFGAIRTLHMMHYSNLSLSLECWDAGGHDRLRGLLPFYLSNSNCVMLMFDVGNRDSFNKVFDYLSKSKNLMTEGALILIIANKVDSKNDREISTLELEKKCLDSIDKYGNLNWCEISARTGYNIHEPFNIISKNITTMINILKSNHRNDKLNSSLANSIGGSSNSIGLSSLNTSSGIGGSNNGVNLPTFFELDEEAQDDGDSSSLPSHIMSNPDIAMIRNNNYSCLERTNKAIPENVIVRLDQPLKIIVEPSINTLVNKIFSINKKILFFKEANDNSDFEQQQQQQTSNNNIGNFGNNSNHNNNNNSSSSNSNSNNSSNSSTPNGSGEVKGSFCIVVDKYHPKRIEFKRRCSTLSNSEVILLCDYRDHLVKTFISLCPPKFKIPLLEGSNSTTINDFIGHFNDCLKSYSKTPIERSYIEKFNRLSTSFSSNSKQTSNINNNNINEVLVNLNLSKMLKDEKYLISTTQSINWNASIETIDISNNSLDTYDLKIFSDLLQSINSSVSIINLNISKNSLNYKHKNSLVEFIQSTKLKSLDLSFNELSSSCNLIAQSLTHNSTLNYLSLSGNKLTNDNAQSLSQMIQANNNSITTLDISENLIEDEGALFLLKAQQKQQQPPQNQQIYLNLQSNPIKHFSKFTSSSSTSTPSSPTSK